MKSKTFVEPRWIAAILFGLVFFIGGAFMLVLPILGLAFYPKDYDIGAVLALIFCVAVSIFSILFYVLYYLPKTFSLISVSSTKIVWRCPFYRTVRMNIADCEYVSVEDMADHNRAMPVIRGDEIAYIYLSNKPFPDKYKHKADIVRRKKGTITFAYSDKLCQELISVLPEGKTKKLVSFYNQMQVSDRVNQHKQQKKSKKK